MDYKLSTLANGLRVITIPMPSLESATVTVWVGTGSRKEDPKVGGISHFLEHMVFKGSQKRPTAREIAEAVDAIGGEFNAATSKEWTNFYIRSRTGSLETAFDVLSDMVLRPILREEDIEREKGVIVEEIAMHEDTPMRDIADVFERLIYKGTDLGRDIIGTKETVRGITKDDFVNYRKTHYYPENMLVTVAGGVTEDQVVKLTEKYFDIFDTTKSDLTFAPAQLSQVAPQVLLKNKTSEQAHFILGFTGYPRGHEKRFAEAVLATILGGNMSSRLFTEIREKRGLAYAVSSDADHYKDTGSFSIYSGVVLTKIDEAIKVCLEQIYGIRDGNVPVTVEELERGKEFLRGHLALSLENTKAVGYFFGEKQLLLDRVDTPDEIFDAIAKVSVDDVVAVAKEIFLPERLNLAVIGPYDDQARFTNLLK